MLRSFIQPLDCGFVILLRKTDEMVVIHIGKAAVLPLDRLQHDHGWFTFCLFGFFDCVDDRSNIMPIDFLRMPAEVFKFAAQIADIADVFGYIRRAASYSGQQRQSDDRAFW